MNLAELVLGAATRAPDALALAGPDGALSYGELSRLADQGARALVHAGVRPGDRVGIAYEKSTRAAAAMQAILRAGAAYVPLDVSAPPARNRAILDDGGVRVLLGREAHAAELGRGAISIDAPAPDAPLPPLPRDPDGLAYVLYTSGSTGVPKGVCISHRNALAFVAWAGDTLAISPADRLGNHAPFTFDLSVFDLYAAFRAGASVHLVPEGAAYDPRRLVELVARERLTVWYSVPSALILMMEHGGLLEREALALRAIVFAGEPFPIAPLRRLRERFSGVRLLNFYGPTETNVCTYHEVGAIDPARTEPVPIGKPCSGDRAYLRALDASELPSHVAGGPHPVGELIVEGPTVMLGYFGREPHRGPYATGDIVRALPDGSYEYLGRRDSMIKLRGHRVELGEIEAALSAHPAIRQAAVIVHGRGMDARLVAFLVGEELPGLVKLKLFSADRLPKYMIIDEARALAELPRTPHGKVDRAALARLYDTKESS